MNIIREWIESGANVSVTIEVNVLKDFGNYLIDCSRRDLEQTVIDDKAETYPSPAKVSEILDVNLSTLFRWKKKGYLVPIEVGGKRRYRMSDVKKLLNK